MEKSHVGMELCYFCQEAKGVILHKRLAKTVPHEGIYNSVPCDECAEHMKQGIILISIENGQTQPPAGELPNPYRSGDWVVINEDGFTKAFGDHPALKSRMAFVDDNAWDKMGLPRHTNS